ncbi:hypothetical protein FSP39_004218 [Pinctada imbricata]|uniref:Reverse transcriptase domain-containing protein n=1 Tax=Pinctada imbricata TaxID=66713 RepID=A0AA89BNJ4_PINIB|nr:hypothetical protein FSP39_004218 [Pinctada imbricata]
MAAIHDCEFNLIENPPYSPDLAPSDFHLFLKLKADISGTHLQSDDDVILAVDGFLISQDKEFLKSGIEALKHSEQKATKVTVVEQSSGCDEIKLEEINIRDSGIESPSVFRRGSQTALITEYEKPTEVKKQGRRSPTRPRCSIQNTKTPGCKNTKDEYSTRRKRDTRHVNIKHKRLHINRRDQWVTGADFGRPSVTQVASGVVFLDYVRTTLSLLQLPRGLEEYYVITPADKASNNYTFTCKKYYFDSLVKEFGLNSTPGNPTYTPTNLSASEIIDNHKSALASFGVDTTNLDLDLPYLYCIPKMHKNPYKQRFIAGSSKCSTKSVSILLTKVLSEIKSGLQKYCSTVYSRSGINQMWILKNSKELLEHLKSTHFSRVHSIKAFDFSTLYTTIPHSKLKERLAKIISNAFTSKNGNRKYKFIVVNYDKTYFVKEKSDSENKYTETDIIQMLNFLIDNIFVVFGGKVFQQIVGIPMGTNCAPLLADIFLYSYEAEFIQSLVSEGKRYLASDFNFTYRYIDDVLSINNPKFADYLSSIYPSELEVKETTETNNSASYLDIMLSYDTDGHMNTSLYDKRDDFNFGITNFPFLSSNIPSSPAYGVFISQLIRYARASTKYTDFVLRARRLSDKLLSQGYVCDRLTSSLRKFYGRYGELVIHYDVPLSRMVDDILS